MRQFVSTLFFLSFLTIACYAQDSLHSMRRYNLSELALDMAPPIDAYKGQLLFFNSAFSEVVALDTASGKHFTYGRKYFADSTKLLGTPLLNAYRQILKDSEQLEQFKMDRISVRNVFADENGIFLLLNVPKLILEPQDSGKQRTAISGDYAIAQVSPEKVLSCQFINRTDLEKSYQIHSGNAFSYKEGKDCLLSLFSPGPVQLPETTLLASFETKNNELVLKQKKAINGKTLLAEDFTREHLYNSYISYPFIWYQNIYGQLIHAETERVYNLGALLTKHTQSTECTIIAVRLFDNKQLVVVSRGYKNGALCLFYSLVTIKKNHSLHHIKTQSLYPNPRYWNLNPKTWLIFSPTELAHYDFEQHLNIYSLRKK